MAQRAIGLGFVAVFAGALIVGCSGHEVPSGQHVTGNAENRGSVELGLVPVSGVTLNSVHYAVTSSATPPTLVAEGDLPTSGSSSEFSFGLSLPVGTGYSISLSAASAEPGDNITCGGAFSPFDVSPNSASNFKVVLTCHDDSNGMIVTGVQTVTDACPRLVFDYEVATPSSAAIGKTIAVQGKAHDLDGKPVSYSWQVTPPSLGTLAPTSGASSVFTCNSIGSQLPVKITANNGECSKVLFTQVTCNSGGECGDGIIDPGETCDTGIPGSECPADCNSVCGDGVAEAPVEDCEPANTDTCNATCNTRVAKCGDGFLTPPETCDAAKVPPGTPSNQLCNSTCTGFINLGICGDGIVGDGEQCDEAVPPFFAGSASPRCSNTCKKISTQACVDCENAGDCFESVNNCLGVAAPFGLSDQSKCFDVLSCIEQTNCFDGTGTLGKCYCGSLSTAACGAAPFTGPGSPDGACVAQIKAGFPTFTTNSAVLGGLTATDFPSGAAMKRLSCQKGANSSACLGVCGFTAGGPAFP